MTSYGRDDEGYPIDTVAGPCPGCDNWQVDFSRFGTGPADLEAVLAEHARKECPELMAMAVHSVFTASVFETVPDLIRLIDGRKLT